MKTKFYLILALSVTLNVALVISHSRSKGSERVLTDAREEALSPRLAEAAARLERADAALRKGREALNAIEKRVAAAKPATQGFLKQH